MSKTTLTSKGQLVIPHAIRSKAKLQEGDQFIVELDKSGSIILKPIQFRTKLENARKLIKDKIIKYKLSPASNADIASARTNLFQTRISKNINNSKK